MTIAPENSGTPPDKTVLLQTVTLHARVRRRGLFDWLFAGLILLAGALAGWRLRSLMDGYDQAILLASTFALIALGWFWRPLARLMLAVMAAVLAAMALYGGDIQRAQQVFWLKYFLSSQSAMLWMGVLVFMATLFHWIGLLLPDSATRKDAPPSSALSASVPTAQRIGSWLAWAAAVMGLTGSGVRWHESYLIGPQVGHVPLSNLYEVFVLFIWMTLLFGLYFESRNRARGLNAFVLLVVSAAVAFLFWYAVSRKGQLIQPLVPALQSWWMTLHVPANFVGYGMFALAAMAGLMCLLKTTDTRTLWTGLAGSPALAAVLLAAAAWGLDLAPAKLLGLARMLAGLAALFAMLIAARRYINPRTPDIALLDDVMHTAIAVGFAFFTIATFLGALWAAQAWGAYWSWDPKEVWALIVWINYAAWLHLRLMKGLRGRMAAWWALAGLVVVTFAFVGVNMFLGGLHSYGRL